MSAILSVDDLNDFISPGVACIKPVETLPAPPPDPAGLENEVILDGQTSSSSTAPAQISLTDCLACSGCVTSAEAVLVSLQSHNEVLTVLDAAPALRLSPDEAHTISGLEDPSSKLFVASVSPQTRANLAAACGNGTTEQQAGKMIEQLFVGSRGLTAGGKHGNGFTWMVDTNTAREACLVLGADEILADGKKPQTPVLTSSCPGWVKSPQALMGTLLKTVLSKRLGITPDRIWHLSIMPCFDKKLEASREELTDTVWAEDGNIGQGVRDVDCVITTKEILMLAESRGRNADVVDYSVVLPSGETVFKAGRYYGFRNIQNLVRKLKPAKASRMPGGKPFGSARRPTGKAGNVEYAYVEVMACPGGCTNGGGQIKVDDQIIIDRKGLQGKPGPQEQKMWLAEVDEAYFSGGESEADEPTEYDQVNGLIDGISPTRIRNNLEHWSRITGVSLDKLVYTSYREVISDIGKSQATDTERVIQLAGKIGGGW
ncbi:hypothetical protein OQA88_4140 [Cercophora sp. LCS_1]